MPDPRQVVQIPLNAPKQDFSAHLQSEDAGQPVQVRLYTDYGIAGSQGPYTEVLGAGAVGASTLSDATARIANAAWTPGSTLGCHTITMMLSHAFDPFGCPCDIDDSSSLTWVVYVCKTADCQDLTLDACTLPSNMGVSCGKTGACTPGASSTGTQ